ncbi:MAG: LacI family DNA-binding transcriptional regulator [Lentisphaeria bacterium]|nr:LacI family DNA-binding transcriptional regulator [Lentisphaeria bacterium]
MLSIKEVARLTGLSTATVSRALDPRYAAKVKPETRARILEICNTGNYRPGLAGRSFATGKSYKVGFISGGPADDFGNLFQGYFFQGVGFELQKAGYSLLLLCAPDNEEKSDLIVNFLRSGVADAYIIGSCLMTEAVEQAVAECQVPVLRLSRRYLKENCRTLHLDLNSAYGDIWRRIPEELRAQTVYCCRNRQENKYQIALEEAPEGYPLPFLELYTSCNLAEVRRHAYLAACEKRKSLEAYKVFWCSSDLMALGIKDAFEEKGKIAGKDFYLIGYDNIEGLPSAVGTPFLSTVDGAWEMQGVVAARTVLETLERQTPVERKIRLKYIRRESFPF